MKTNNPFIAAACDQAGEVCELLPLSPAWCASVDAELASTAEADAGPLGWYAATETAAEEYDLDGEFVRSLFVELLPAWLLAPEETHLLIEIDSLISEDDYGIYGSDFYQCRLCHGESGAGVLNKGIVHEDSCPLADSNYAKAVEKTRQAFASITLPAAAVAEGQERDGESRANSLHKVNTAALESSVGHLSTLVDELRRLLGAAMQTMSELHVSAEPDESTADIDARIPGAAFAKFVNEHAQLLFEIKNGCAAAPAPTLPAAAVAEGAQLDGESLEQGE